MPEKKFVVGAVNVSSSEVKCPGCGSSIGIKFDPDSRNIVCPFCGLASQLPEPDANKTVEELDFSTALQRANVNWGYVKKLIICANCGGQALYNAEQVTGACPFCGSTSVTPAAENVQIMAPQAVIPFEISPEMTQKLFTDFLTRKSFVSKKVASSKLEHVIGIYLPFWTFDTLTVTSYRAESFGDDNNPGQSFYGVWNRYIDDLVVFASDKIRLHELGRIQNFDFSKMVPYSPEFLAGIPAERYTVGLNEGWERCKLRIRQIVKRDMYDIQKGKFFVKKYDTNCYNVKFRYLLAPVYVGRYTVGKVTYYVAINGQTGQTFCEAPTYLFKLILLIITVFVLSFVLLGVYLGLVGTYGSPLSGWTL